MPAARTSSCPTDLALEEHRVLPDLRVSAHVASCPHCRGWLTAADRLGEHFEKEIAPWQLPRLHRALEEAPPARPSFPIRFLGAVGATAAAAGVALVLILSPIEKPPVILAKGGGLTVFVRHDGDVHAVQSGESIAPGDALRFSVVPPGRRLVWVLSVDSSGEVSRLAPAEGGPAEVTAPVMLPGSAVLDESPGPERIFAVLSKKPLPWSTVEQAANRAVHGGGEARVRDLDRLPIPGTEQSTLLLERRR